MLASYQGHRSKIGSGKEKFDGQLLASFVNRIGDLYHFQKPSEIPKVADARSMAAKKSLNF